MKAAVTGSSGFVGSHLVPYLRSRGDDVVTIDRSGTPPVDVTDAVEVREVLRAARPDAVYHLAALSHVGESWDAPEAVFRVNAAGALNVLRACADAGVERVLVAGSADVYGVVGAEDLPLTEEAPIRPVTPYGASKAAADVLALQAFLGDGLATLRVRAFNHTGPGQSPRFVAAALAERVAANELTGRDMVPVGDLSARRDFLDVRDVVRAYRLLAEKGEAGEAYNVCSGRAVSIREVADHLLSLACRPMKLELDAERLRPVEVPVHWGDNTKLRTVTGWQPSMSLEQSLADVLAWWRDQDL